MSSRREKRGQKLERKTARVFFSSPFGGLEEEREELTKKYWPKLESMCNKEGYDFIPVDLRWGITSEMSSSAVTIKVCLSEMDRSDMIVGFFGQRYGWHGDNELLQKSFDVAAELYSWLNEYRDKSVTELEYLHGHLRDPGTRAACFFFRDKAYDDMKLKEAQKTEEEREMRKFVSSTDGPHAAELLADLKQRIEKTRDKCLAVHMNYSNPTEGARLMFETIEKYFNDVLLSRPSLQLSSRDEENIQHDVFLASRLGMGGVYVGGDKYLDMIDKHVLTTEDNTVVEPVLVLGTAGSGKSCLLSNWITRHQLRNPHDIVIYHFIASTSGGTDPRFILSRLVDELNEELREREVHDNNLTSSRKDEVRELIRKLNGLMQRANKTGCKVFIIIDALNKVEQSGQTMKPLYWLPKDLPDNIHLLVSTSVSDAESVDELNDRKYHTFKMKPLDLNEREEMALMALKKRGKTLSTEQRRTIFKQKQTDNPLYLETLLKELVSFGEFFQLDSYIDSLIQANDTVGLFLKFLERLEKDYNPDGYHGNIIEEIMCCIHVSRQGLSESEIKSILNITNHVWSSVFFAMDDFLTERNGLYSFGYDELADAVSQRYFQEIETKQKYIEKVAAYFDVKLQDRSALYDTKLPDRVIMELPWLLKTLGDTDRLIRCVLKPAMFYSLRSGESKYDLISYWNATDLSGEDIVAKHSKVIDDQLTLFYNEGLDQGQDTKHALLKTIPYVYQLAQFLNDAGHSAAVQPITERALEMMKSLHSAEDIKHDPAVAYEYVNVANTMACLYVDIEEFDKAEELHNEVVELKQRFESVFEDGQREVAKTLNGLGVLSFKRMKNEEALHYYQRSLDKHREAQSPSQEIADILNNMGTVYHVMGQWDDAVKVFKDAMEIYEEAYFGRLPADVGGTLLNLAMAYRRLDKDDEAEVLYLRALKIRENAYGSNHHEVGQTLLSYSAFLLDGNPAKAAEVSKRAAAIYETSLGLDHLNTLNALENVALAYLMIQKPEEAHPYFKRAGERKDATNRMDTSIARMNAVMADYYLNSGQNDEARLLFGRVVKANFASDRDFAALDFLDCALPANKRLNRTREQTVYHGIEKFPNSVMILGRIQGHYSHDGNVDEMMKVLENGNFGVEHYNNAYEAFVNCKHKKVGVKLLEKAHTKYPEDKIVLYNLASAYFSYKDYTKSSILFKKLLDLDPSDVNTLEAYANAVSLAGRPHEARDLYSKAVKLAEASGDQELIRKLHSSIKLLNEM